MIRLRSGTVGALLAVLLPATIATADVLHLEGGRAIRTPAWWTDGDTIVYESPAGTVGIPRSLVVRVEASEEPEPAAAPTPLPDPALKESTGGPASGVTLRALGEQASLLLEGKSALDRRDFETAAAVFLDLVRRHPEISAARVGYALSAMALDRDQLALDVILDGLAREPDHPRLRELLGDLRNREERVEDAVREWRQAFRLDPGDRLREKILKGERELQAGRHYTFATTPHFNVRYGDDLDPELASAVVDTLEEQYWVLSDLFRHAPLQPITVLLYPERAFRDVTQAPDNVAGLYDGKIRVPLGGVRRLDPRARSLLVHELTHAVIHAKTRGNCPRWLHEGLAQRMEERPLTDADRLEIVHLLDGIAPHTWQDHTLSYPAALSLVIHLERRRGLDGLVRVLERLGEGASIDRALESVYGERYESICRRWAEDLTGGQRR